MDCLEFAIHEAALTIVAGAISHRWNGAAIEGTERGRGIAQH
jgi:hypothetical protein